MIKEVSMKECDPSLLNTFDCGEEALNEYLLSYSRQNDRKGFGRTFVLLDRNEIVGYYTLSSAHIHFENISSSLNKRIPRYPAPAARIDRLAVAKNKQGQGIGSILMRSASKRIVLASISLGIAFVLVDAKEGAEGFYEHFGFVRLMNGGHRFALPISVVLKLLVE